MQDTPKSGIFSSVKIMFWAFRLYFSIFPFKTVTLFITGVLDYLTPIGSDLILAFAINSIVVAAQTKDLTVINNVLFVMLGYQLLKRLNKVFYRFSFRLIRNNGRNKLRQKVFEKLQTVNIEDLESPEIQNRLQRVDENVSLTTDFISISTDLIGGVVGIISLIVIVWNFYPIMVPVIVMIAIPISMVNRYFISQDWKIEFDSTEGRRVASSSAGFLMSAKHLVEVNITGGYNLLAGKFSTFFDSYNARLQQNRVKWLSSEYAVNLIGEFALLFGFAHVFTQFILGTIQDIGTATFQISSLRRLFGSVTEIGYSITNIQENSTRISDFFELMNRKFESTDGHIELPRLQTGPEIEFKNVTFTYPRSEKPIYENLNLHIKSGQKIAIVGHNGAGKTTLVRMIARLYRVSSGEILINNINLNDIKIDDWYKNIGILFQEYNTYGHLTARENIYIGRSVKPLDEEKIIESAKSADALEFIEEFPDKFDQILSEQYKKGKRPSTGQWQKLAIARFFYRNAPLVIFDEPTASIDAVSEFKIFNRIYDFFQNKTVIIISHRFSTVRNADRIIVMDHGQIIEEGTHAELMAQQGKYAEAFKLQAEGYQS